MSNDVITSTSKVLSKGTEIEVGVDKDTIERIASTATTATYLASDSVKDLIGRTDMESCYAYSMEVVLYQNSGGKPSYERIPAFLTDICKTLNCKYRGVAIRVKALEQPKRPDSYGLFLDIMASLGVPCEKVSHVDPDAFSKVLLIRERTDSEGVQTLVGTEDSVCIDDLVIRSMLTVAQEQQDILDRIIGYSDEMYGSKDELIRQWAVSFPVAKR